MTCEELRRHAVRLLKFFKRAELSPQDALIVMGATIQALTPNRETLEHFAYRLLEEDRLPRQLQ